MNRFASALFWCALGFVVGPLVALRVALPLVIGGGVLVLVITLLCSIPKRPQPAKKSLPQRKTRKGYDYSAIAQRRSRG
jgi:hypothetical protein